MPTRTLSAFVAGGGEMGAKVRAFDWSKTSLDAIETWPRALVISLDTMLLSAFAECLFWGPELTMFYNDAYAPILGSKPEALGRPFAEVWAEAWETVGPIAEKAMAGEASYFEDLRVPLERHGYQEDGYFTFSYSPVRDESGVVRGMRATIVETTQKVRAQAELRQEREQFSELFEQSPTFMAVLREPCHRFQFYNPTYQQLVGDRELIGRTVAEALPEVVEQGFIDILDRVYATGVAFRATGAPVALQTSRDEPPEQRFVDFVYQPIKNAMGKIDGIFVEGVDVTDRVMAERRHDALIDLTDAIQDLTDPGEIALAASRILGETLNVSRAGYGTVDFGSETVTVEKGWCAEGIPSGQGTHHFRDYGSYIEDLKAGKTVIIADAYRDPRTRDAADALKSVHCQAFVNRPIIEEGRLVALLYLNHTEAREWLDADLELIQEFAARTRSAVERARVAAELQELNRVLEARVDDRTRELLQAEEALRQAQKMEAVGQLTGGIAHDFNNMLAVVMGSLELLNRRIGAEDLRAKHYVTAAYDGTKRAANLTQRLLAFSRQQPLQPGPVNPNSLVANMTELLRHSLGPVVKLETVLAGGIWRTFVDRNQLENVILNLGVNARDAMPDGGKLTIETQNAYLDERYAAREPGVKPGQYVLVAVSDTGVGMTADVLAKAFDPFFTAKPIGKGTGLGLSQVYGFIKQSGGHVRIYSEVGQGTTVKIYLPRYLAADVPQVAVDDELPVPLGEEQEVILVVDDEPAVRHFSADALRELGYRVLEAENAAQALALLEAHPAIALLFTDVVMPDVNGKKLADEALRRRSDLKVLFTTGYTRNAVVHNGVLDTGVYLIGKPFTLDELAAKVREVLDG